MLFAKGNKAAAKSSRKAIAATIAQRLKTGGDSLSDAQFTTLAVKASNLLVKRRRPRRKDPEAKKVSANDYQWLTPEQNEIHRAVMQIEAEEHAKGIVHRRYSDGSTE
jgi:hypothetical protein